MKKMLGIFLGICVLIALVEEGKPSESDTQNARISQSSTNSPQLYSNQSSNQYSNTVTYVCPMCSGTGEITCRVCKGTGENAIYDNLSSVQKGFSKPYCEACDGNGWITCGRCHGTGVD